MKKRLLIALLVGVVLTLSGCSSNRVTVHTDTITEFGFELSDIMLLIGDCIDSKIVSCDAEKNSIKVVYENGASVYNHIDMDLEPMQTIIIKGDADFLDEKLDTLLKILVFSDEREKEFEELLVTLRETGKGTIALSSVMCNITYEAGCLTVSGD